MRSRLIIQGRLSWTPFTPTRLALIRKLESIAPLAPEEKAAILRLPLRLKTVRGRPGHRP